MESPHRTGAPCDANGHLGAVSVVEDWAGLCALETEWNDLFGACERPSLCATHAWSAAWWQAFGENVEGSETGLYVVVVRDGEGRLIGVAPFYEERPSSPLRVRRLRILGFIGHDGIFDMTEEPTVLVRTGCERPVLEGIAEATRSGLREGRWDAAYFRIHGETIPLKACFARLRASATVWTELRAGSDYAELPASWAEYRKAMTKSMRDNLGYYPRLLTREGHDWQIRILRCPEEMPAAAARLVELHHARAASGKGERHDDHIHGPSQRRFLLGLLERLSAEGRAFVAELTVNGSVIASQAFVESDGQMMVYYSGYDEAWYRYSPIFVIDAFVFKEALERGVRRLDFLRNIAPWKTRWLAKPGPRMQRAVLVSRRTPCRLRYGVYTCRQAFHRNVTVRVPILCHRLLARTRARVQGFLKSRGSLAKNLPAVLPTVEQIGARVSPVLHATMLHHRTISQIVGHR